MVATEFLSYINTFSAVSFIGIEDLADKANFQWNVIALLLSMILVTVRQYFMAPLVCYFPNTLSGANAEQYVTNLCWVEGTYPWNMSAGAIPHEDRDWDKMKPIQMNYYQWVPLVLGLMAILFYLPRIAWSIYVYNRTGTDLEGLVKLANSTSKEDGDNRDKNITHIARSLELLLFSRRGLKEFDPDEGRLTHKVLSVMPAKRHGNNLIFYYIAIKFLYAIIGLVELFIMYRFLRFNAYEGYFWFGYRLLHDLVNGRQWTETQIFPRIGICRHSMQNVGSNNKIFAQCVLPINMLNEKIFIFLYFFISFVVLMTIVSIPLWAFRMGPKHRQRHFIKRFLKMADAYRRDDVKQKEIIASFIERFLRSDGNFILRMLSMNAGDMVTVEIVCCLFNRFSKDYINKDFRGKRTINRPPPNYPKKAKNPPVPLGGGDVASKKNNDDPSPEDFVDNFEQPTSVHSNDAMSRKYPSKIAYQSANV